MIIQLTKKLKSVLETVGKFHNVYNYEPSNFNGSPVATVVPASNENAYSTTTENERLYAFEVRVYINRGKDDTQNALADEALRDLYDETLDELDKNYLLSGLETKPGYTFINMRAVPGSWGYAGLAQEYRFAVINITCRVYVDVNVIT
jgi:hypothetical protein